MSEGTFYTDEEIQEMDDHVDEMSERIKKLEDKVKHVLDFLVEKYKKIYFSTEKEGAGLSTGTFSKEAIEIQDIIEKLTELDIEDVMRRESGQ